jgi:hypothetical protein
MNLHPCLPSTAPREERAIVGVRKGLCYKFGVTGGWKSSQEMYELIRWEMIDGRRETRTQCIMLQERGAPWSAKARANRTQWRDVYGEMLGGEWPAWPL